MSFLWSLGSFIIAIGVLVAVHEYGHFWAARKCGIKVLRFSLGFGKVIWSRVDKQGTEFAISIIPLGGYVKMLDERQENVPVELKEQAFNNKTVAQRAFVAAAGPFFNFLFAIIAYAVVFFYGIPAVKPVIAEVMPQSIAAQAQIPANSEILAIDGDKVEDWSDINMLLATKIGQHNVNITLTPFASGIEKTYHLNLTNWHFDPEKEAAFIALGMEPVRNKVEMTLSKVLPNSVAAQAGLQVGDKLTLPNGHPLNWKDFVEKIQKGQEVTVEVFREQEHFTKTLVPHLNNKGRYIIGISPTIKPIQPEYLTEIKYGPFESLVKGVEKTAHLSWLTVKVIGKLLVGDLDIKNLSGPISIAKGAGATSQIGLIYFLSFMALISVNLGIMNLFPLPVLDGGHLFFLLCEGIRGKPLSEKTQDFAYRIGASLLLMLTCLALFNDFLRL